MVHFNLDSIVVWYTSFQWEESPIRLCIFFMWVSNSVPFASQGLQNRNSYVLILSPISYCFVRYLIVLKEIFKKCLFSIYSCLPLEFCFNKIYRWQVPRREMKQGGRDRSVVSGCWKVYNFSIQRRLHWESDRRIKIWNWWVNRAAVEGRAF